MTKHTTLKSKFSSAFSLVELLVVIAVIAVIAAIAIPNITGTREAAVAAQEGYNADAQARFITQVNAVGATNASGEAASVANVTNGASFTNAATAIGFTYTQ